MKNLILLLIAFLLLLSIVSLTAQNTQLVSIEFFFWEMETLISILCFVCFSIGIFTAIFFLLPAILHKRGKEKQPNSNHLETPGE